MKKYLITIGTLLSGMFLSTMPAFAHVVVKPTQVGVAAFQTFTMGVPVEKDNPTIGVRLLIPEGLKYVTPNVKPGWKIDIKKSGSGDNATVTEIDYSGGSIPAGQCDEFNFSAQVPSTETTLKWKAYQMYQDRSTVEWIHDPSKNPEDDSAPPPYSTTKVVNDLTASNTQPNNIANAPMTTYGSKKAALPLGLSSIAFILSVISLAIALRKK